MYLAQLKLAWSRFFRLAWKTYVHKRGSAARLSLRRGLKFFFLIPALGLLQLVHWLAFFLDDLFFPAYRQLDVSAPVFILGIPRSGTTFMQRVLARDTEQMAGLPLWECIFAPAIIERLFWRKIGRLDKALGGWGRRVLGWIDRRLFLDIKDIHPTSLFWQEEDELIFFPIFSTGFLMYQFPFPEELGHLPFFDDQTPEKEKKLIMAFHKRCIQRHLYVHGAHKHYLAKNVLSTAKLNAFREWFPNARIICSVRSPYDCVPSSLSLAAFMWRQFANGGDDEEIVETFTEIQHYLYKHPMDVLEDWPDHQRAVVKYEELRADLEGTVRRLYEQLGLELSPAFEAVLAEEAEKSRAYKSKHKYAATSFGLTYEAIYARFRDVFDHYGFDPAPANVTADNVPQNQTGSQGVRDGGRTEAVVSGSHEKVPFGSNL